MLIKRNTLFRFIIWMIMISTFLPLAGANTKWIFLPYVWVIIWFAALIAFYPRVYQDKFIVFIFIYALFIIVATKTFWNGMDRYFQNGLFQETYYIFTGASIITYFRLSGDYRGLAVITAWSILFLIITAIMTIYVSGIDPLFTRNVVGISALSVDEQARLSKYFNLGAGGYSTAITFMALVPVLIYYIKSGQLNIKLKIIFLSILIIFALALIKMQIFTNIVIAFILSIIAFTGLKRYKQAMVVLTVLTILALSIPKTYYLTKLRSFSAHLDEYSDIGMKVADLAIFMESDNKYVRDQTAPGSRLERYPQLWNTFFQKPLLGSFFLHNRNPVELNPVTAHLYWMYKLTIMGLVGFSFFLLIFIKFLRESLRVINSDYKYYYLAASLGFLAYGIFKVLGGQAAWYAFFILLPGINYLSLLTKKNPEDSGQKQ